MSTKSYELHGVRIYECAADGPPLANDRDAVELIGAASEQGASLIVIPTERLGDDFFRLKTLVAGDIIQKFVTYQWRVAIVGDISRYVAQISALRDFVYECNRGRGVWFVADMEDLEKRVKRESRPTR